MRPPWLGHSRDEAELEALQTDIMRFMAILGLCLAAIFSLVQGAALEQAAAEKSTGEHAAVEQAVVKKSIVEKPIVEKPVVEKPVVEKPVVEQAAVEKIIDPAPPAREPPPPIAQSAPVLGFTLEFASVQALETLLQAGQVQLYARYRDQFWSVDTHGVAVSGETPSSYYKMHTETVPHRLRSALPDIGNGAAITWGVTLPIEAIGQIQRLTTGRKGGNLLIGYDGAVALESTSGNVSR